MKMSLARTSYMIPLTTVYRQRLLPVPGRLLVRQGQKVAPQDVVAQANIAAEHVLLDVARGLQVPAKAVDKYIDRVAGELISEGDVIATGPKGLVQRTMRSPCDGRIVYIKNGQVLLQSAESPFELVAGYAGVISELIPDRGVVVELAGALVQGVWGNGRVEFGVMTVIARDPGTVLKIEHVDVSSRGGILVSGILDDEETLQSLAEIPVRGLILASVPSRLLPAIQQAPFPVMLTEGFGRIPMNSAAFRLLSTNTGREISLNAEANDPYQGTRPEGIIPLPVSGKPTSPPLVCELAAQQKVRVLRAPYQSQVGVILDLRSDEVILPNGIRAKAANVRLDSGERVIIPLANLEVLEYK
jgi:hypothetical protein